MMCKNKINIGEKTILFKNESFLNNLHFYLNEMLAPPHPHTFEIVNSAVYTIAN